MKAIIIEDPEKLQKKNSKQNNVPSIWFTAHKHPKKQKKEDNELFVYPPSNNKKKQRGGN